MPCMFHYPQPLSSSQLNRAANVLNKLSVKEMYIYIEIGFY